MLIVSRVKKRQSIRTKKYAFVTVRVLSLNNSKPNQSIKKIHNISLILGGKI